MLLMSSYYTFGINRLSEGNKVYINFDRNLIEADINLYLSFNASARQFETDDFYNLFKKLMEEENQDIKITMEVTESLLFEDENRAIDLLERIKSLGVKIALNDFGTGYSSISYLNQLLIDYIYGKNSRFESCR